MTAAAPLLGRRIAGALYSLIALGFFVYLLGYYWTSEGGPTPGPVE